MTLFVIKTNAQDCSISDVYTEIQDCNENDQFYVDIEFNYENTSSGFIINGNGNNYGQFEYGEPFYTVGPFEADCNTLLEFVIIDLGNELCTDFYAFTEPVCCNANCEIEVSNIAIAECDSTGYRELQFVVENDSPGNSGFDVYYSNGFVMHFEYGNSPYFINIPGYRFADFLSIRDTDTPECETYFDFDNEDCENAPECSFSNGEFGSLREFVCTSDSTYEAYILIDDYHGNDDSLWVHFYTGDDLNSETNLVAVTDFPFLVGEFDISGELYTFYIQEQDNPFCITGSEWNDAPDCSNFEECQIFELIVDPQGCDGNGFYSLYLNFEYENPGNDFFEVYSGNNYLGFYSLHELPIIIDSFPSRDVEHDIITVCINDNINCCQTLEFLGPDCEDDECRIFEMIAEAHECDSAGRFFVDIAFEIENPGDAGFIITGNGIVYDTFDYGQNFYTIGPIDVNCDLAYEFIVIDLALGCEQETGLQNVIPCCQSQCEISEIEVFDFECNNDGTYNLSLNFNYEGTTNDFFDVFAGNQFVGFYAYADLPIRIQGFTPRDVEYDLIRICDNDNPNCCAVHEFLGPDCDAEQDCEFFDVIAEAHECDSHGQFYVDIAFDIENPGDEGFIIRGNGIVYDTFDYGHNFYTIGPIEANCDLAYEFIVIDLELGCSKEVGLHNDISCCHSQCEISEIEVFDFECNNDGTYNLTLNFGYNGNTNDFFDVFAGNHFIGFYAYSDLPIRIQGFTSRDVEYDLIRICDNDNPNCCAVLEFMGPDCDEQPDCTLDNLTVIETECLDNGNILVVVDFDLSRDQNRGLDIFANGHFQYYERVSETPLEIILEGIDKKDSVLLKICVNDMHDCCEEIAFLPQERHECELIEINAIQTLCDDDFFYIVVDAEHNFTNPQQEFILRGNGRFYGEYTVSNLPVALGPFHIEENINEIAIKFKGIEDCVDAQELEINCDCTSSIIEIESDIFMITENAHEILIESKDPGTFQIEFLSLDGRKLLSASAYNQYSINKKNYSTGIYILKLSVNGNYKSFKLFISE